MRCCGSRRTSDPESPGSEADDCVIDAKDANTQDTPREMVEWSVDPSTRQETFEDPYMWRKRTQSLNSPTDSQRTLVDDDYEEVDRDRYGSMTSPNTPRTPERALPNVWDKRQPQNRQRSYPPTNKATIPRAALDVWPPVDAIAAAKYDDYPSKPESLRYHGGMTSNMNEREFGSRDEDGYSRYSKTRPMHRSKGREKSRSARPDRYEFHDSGDENVYSREGRSFGSKPDTGAFAGDMGNGDLPSYPKPVKVKKQQPPLHMPTEEDFDRYGRQKKVNLGNEENVPPDPYHAQQRDDYASRKSKDRLSKSRPSMSKTHASAQRAAYTSSDSRSRHQRPKPDYDSASTIAPESYNKWSSSANTLVPSPPLPPPKERPSKSDNKHSSSSKPHSKSKSKPHPSHHTSNLAPPTQSSSDVRRRASAPTEAQQKLNTIQHNFKMEIRPLVKQYIKDPPRDEKKRVYEQKKLAEMMMRECLLKYDAVDVHGDNPAGMLRKEGVRECNKWLQRLDYMDLSVGGDGEEVGRVVERDQYRDRGREYEKMAGMKQNRPDRYQRDERDRNYGYKEELLRPSHKSQGRKKNVGKLGR